MELSPNKIFSPFHMQAVHFQRIFSIISFLFFNISMRKDLLGHRQSSKEMSTSMKIIDMFNIKGEDGRGIKKETSQEVLSDLMHSMLWNPAC